MVAMDFYAFWNGSQVADVLTTVVGIVGTSDYRVGMSFLALAGFLTVTALSAVRFRGGDVTQWFFATVLFFFIVFVPKANVTVHDVRAQTVRTVANVPMGVAFVACATSQIGKWTAELFETGFQEVDAARFTKFGAVFPERVVAALQTAGPVLPSTRALLTPFVERCVAPELLESDAKLAALMASPNLLGTISENGWLNPARFFLQENGQPLYCTEALPVLRQHLETVELPAQERKLFLRLADGSESLAGHADGTIEAALRQAIPEAQALMLGISASMKESLEHSLLLTELPKGIGSVAGALSGGSGASAFAASVRLSESQGFLSSEISFRTMGELAKAYLPKLRNLLEVVLIGAFPLVFLAVMALGTQGGAILRMYATLFVWISLWAPLAAVMNSLVVRMDASPMTRLIAEYGGLTLQAADAVRVLGASSQAMAGYLFCTIPILAYAIVRASEMGAVSLASSILTPAQGAAQAQSANAAMGNVTAGVHAQGSVNLGSVQAGKTDLSAAYASPDIYRNTTPYGSVVRDGSTGGVTAMQVSKSDLGVDTSAAWTNTVSNAEGSAVLRSTASTSGTVFGNTNQMTSTEGTALLSSSGAVRSSSVANGRVNTETQGVAWSNGVDMRTTGGFSQGGRIDESLGINSGGGFKANDNWNRHIESESALNSAPSSDPQPIYGNADGLPSIGGLPNPSIPSLPAPMNFIANPGTSVGKSTPQTTTSRHRTIAIDPSVSFDVKTGVSHDNASTLAQSAGQSSSWSETGSGLDSRSFTQTDGLQTTDARNRSDTRAESETATASILRQSGLNSSEGEQYDARRTSAQSGAVSTRTANDPMLRDRVLSLYGSPEAALEALATPSGRTAVGHSATHDTGTTRNVLPTLEAVNENAAQTHEPRHQLMERAVAADADQAFAERLGARNAMRNESSDVKSAFEAPPPSVVQPLGFGSGERESAWLSAGATRVVAATYQQDLDAGTLAQVGLFFGVGYETPAERFDALMAKADENPELRSRLIEAGQRTDLPVNELVKTLNP